MRATDAAAAIKGVYSFNHLHVYNLDHKPTTAELMEYIKLKNINDVQCEALKSKYPERYSSFKVSFPSKFFEQVNTPDFWPQDACVNRFLFRIANKETKA